MTYMSEEDWMEAEAEERKARHFEISLQLVKLAMRLNKIQMQINRIRWLLVGVVISLALLGYICCGK